MAPKSRIAGNAARAFVSGGIICCAGQALLILFGRIGLDEKTAAAAVSISLIFLGAFLTAIHVYDKLARVAGAGTLVPITGFANSVTASAIEFRSEGLVKGTAAKMFVIAGPVLVFGVTASIIYGAILWIVRAVSS